VLLRPCKSSRSLLCTMNCCPLHGMLSCNLMEQMDSRICFRVFHQRNAFCQRWNYWCQIDGHFHVERVDSKHAWSWWISGVLRSDNSLLWGLLNSQLSTSLQSWSGICIERLSLLCFWVLVLSLWIRGSSRLPWIFMPF
jgi:hypothetical protein